MFGSAFTVGHIRGIAIEIHPTWFLVVALLSWTLATGVFPSWYEGWSELTYWLLGIVAALLLFAAVLLHELAHAIVATHRGLPVPKITLFIFGGVSHLARQPRSPGEEFYIAAAGPAVSFIISVVALAVAWAAWGRQDHVTAVAAYLSMVNFAIGIFNVLPGFPLDGGRVMRSIAWKKTGSFRKATAIAAQVGQVFGVLLMIGGLGFLLAGFIANGIWFAFIGWFLSNAARAEADNLRLETILGPLKARDVMSPDYAIVSPGLSLQFVVDEYMVNLGHRAVVVARDDAVLGILTISDIRGVPRPNWDSTSAQAVMTPRERIVTVDAGDPALAILEMIAQKGLNQVPVLEEGRMIGIVTRRDLIERIHVAEQMGADRAPVTTREP